MVVIVYSACAVSLLHFLFLHVMALLISALHVLAVIVSASPMSTSKLLTSHSYIISVLYPLSGSTFKQSFLLKTSRHSLLSTIIGPTDSNSSASLKSLVYTPWCSP